MEKISFEHCVYESIDDINLSVIYQNSTKKIIQGIQYIGWHIANVFEKRISILSDL